jgi:hypothetical protein
MVKTQWFYWFVIILVTVIKNKTFFLSIDPRDKASLSQGRLTEGEGSVQLNSL